MKLRIMLPQARAVREMECPKSMQVTFQQCLWKLNRTPCQPASPPWAFESLDSVDLREVFARKAVVMKVPPRFLKGAYCAALRWYEVICGPRPPSQKWPRASPQSAVSSAVDWFRSTRASRGSLGPTSWNWEGSVPSRSCNLCRSSASGAVGSSVGSSRGYWTRSHHASDGVEESEAGRTRATSGCPDEFVRAVRHQSTTAFDGGR